MGVRVFDKKQVADVAQSSLSAFEEIASSAEAGLADQHVIGVENRNTFTELEAIRVAQQHNQVRREALQILAVEPAIARIRARKGDGQELTLFITRASPQASKVTGATVVSFRAPIGAIASHRPGDDFEYSAANGKVTLEVIEVAKLHPSLGVQGWDSKNSVLEAQSFKPVTVTSLRAFLADLVPVEDVDVLDALLAEDRERRNFFEGIKRGVITKMGLRDQPILDRFQGEIFRLPLDKRLLLLGPPGTGKTTTLIRRLGQKLDSEHLNEHEKLLLSSAGQEAGHKQSWLMFTPTDLLKQYIKEAFNREQIPAPNACIATWTDYRHDLARARLGILQTPTSKGQFILNDKADIVDDQAMSDQVAWFEDFFRWQGDLYWSEAAYSARELGFGGDSNFSAVAKQLEGIYRSRARTSDAAMFVTIVDAAGGIRAVIDRMKQESDGQIRKALNTAAKRDRTFLDVFGAFLKDLTDDADEADEQGADDEDEQRPTRVGREAAMNLYMQAVRMHCRSLARGRSLSAGSRIGRIIQWLGDRLPTHGECLEIGRSVRTQDALGRHLNPIQRYVDEIPQRYRQFRRLRQSEGRWYRPDAKLGKDITDFELDLVLLAMLRTGGEILKDRRAMSEIDNPTFAALKRIKDLYKNQIMVDEVADFSPLQLGCMGALAEPRINSFFACGDFNQRMTEFGIKAYEELTPLFPDIEVRTVEITYRHTRQLNEFAKAIVMATNKQGAPVALPKDVDSEGFKPVLGRRLSSLEAIGSWLADRIVEVQRASDSPDTFPSIAVLVNSEVAVQPLAEQLSVALATQNLRAVACPEGKVIGQENDVRIFDVQHIKGLEFEAVFFVGVDELAKQRPTLFDKYLYVGATRAATYLGLTCARDKVPDVLERLSEQFGNTW